MKAHSCDDDSIQSREKELHQTLDEARSLGNILVGKGRELMATGQHRVDWAEITREAMPLMGTPQKLLSVNDSWKNTNNYVGQTMKPLAQIDLFAISSTSTTSALTSMLTLPVIQGSISEGFADNEIADRLNRHIEEQSTKSLEKENVMTLMRSLKLDSIQPGTRSPLEQIETSYKAFELTVDTSTPALTSLIPMRQCILQTIDVLLKRRKHQEKALKTVGKVTSILRQLKRDSIPEKLIEDIAVKCKDILEHRLSSSKNAMVTRSEWLHSLVASTLWLKSFLTAIDPSKMRYSAT